MTEMRYFLIVSQQLSSKAQTNNHQMINMETVSVSFSSSAFFLFIHSLHPTHAAVNTKNRTNLCCCLNAAIILKFLMGLIYMIYLVPQMRWKRKQDAQQGLKVPSLAPLSPKYLELFIKMGLMSFFNHKSHSLPCSSLLNV